jgi:hypothetical protein
MEQDIDSAVKRGRAYWFADGFSELVLGIFCIVLGGAILLRGWAGQGGFLAGFGSAALDFSVLKAVCLLAAFLAIWWLKDRFTYPRTGYVRGRKIPPAVILTLIRNILLVVLLPLLGAAAVLIFVPPARAVLAYLPAVSPAGIGLLWGIPCYAAGEWMGLRRFRLMGLLMILAGAAIGAWQTAVGFPVLSAEALEWNFLEPLPEALRGSLDDLFVRTLTGVGILTAFTGAGFIVTGAAAFLRYRKENPEPYREES